MINLQCPLLQLVLHRYFVSSRLQEACKWTGSSWTKAAVARSAALCNGAAALHDCLLSSVDPFITLKVRLQLGSMYGCMKCECASVVCSKLGLATEGLKLMVQQIGDLPMLAAARQAAV